MAAQDAQDKETSAPEQMVEIQRVYLKDASLETPGAPDIFREEWSPEVTVDLGVKHSEIEKNVYEVVLAVTITASMKDKVVFLVEAHQAGIFYITGFEGEAIEHILNAYCPNILFPYVRARIADFIMQASFPQLNLNPVNFDLLYAEKKRAEAEEKTQAAKEKEEK